MQNSGSQHSSFQSPQMTVEQHEEAFMNDDEVDSSEPISTVQVNEDLSDSFTLNLEENKKQKTVMSNKKKSSSKNANRKRYVLRQEEKERRQATYERWRKDQDLFASVRSGEAERRGLKQEQYDLRQSDSYNSAEILRGLREKFKTRREQIRIQADSRKKVNLAAIKQIESKIERLELQLKNSNIEKKMEKCRETLQQTEDNVRNAKKELNKLRATHPIAVMDFAFHKKNPAPWRWFEEVQKQKYFALQNTPENDLTRPQLINEYTHVCVLLKKPVNIPTYKPNNEKTMENRE